MPYLRSPINYMGGKYRSLKNIIPNFCEHDTLYDVFSGSGTIHLNSESKNVYVNDFNRKVIEIQKFISENEPHDIYEQIKKLSFDYNLDSNSSEGYKKLRDTYNESNDIIMLMALSQYSFNYLIRFNKKGGFNASHGKGITKLSQDYLEKIVNFNNSSNKKQAKFYHMDFREFFSKIKPTQQDLVYCDPPYMLSEAVYNEKRANGGWSKEDSVDLLNILDDLDRQGVKFALSEMIFSKGRANSELNDWIEDNSYKTLEKNVQYLGVPSTHNNEKKSLEVLITNY